MYIEAKELEAIDDKTADEEIFMTDLAEEDGQKLFTEKRKSEKYLQVGFQFLKKKVIEKIKKSANLMKEKPEQEEKSIEQFIYK